MECVAKKDLTERVSRLLQPEQAENIRIMKGQMMERMAETTERITHYSHNQQRNYFNGGNCC
jgi:hypothetical protein